jgi:hypothetical protein
MSRQDKSIDTENIYWFAHFLYWFYILNVYWVHFLVLTVFGRVFKSFLFFSFFSLGRVSYCSLVWPQTCNPTASVSWVLGLQPCTITPNSTFSLCKSMLSAKRQIYFFLSNLDVFYFFFLFRLICWSTFLASLCKWATSWSVGPCVFQMKWSRQIFCFPAW